jgi:hypothetical protein
MEIITPENYFLQQGILGIIIVVLAGVIVWQQRRLDKKDVDIKKLYESIDTVQEKRLVDNEKHITNIVGLGERLVTSIDAVQKSIDGVSRVQEMQRKT